MPRPPALDGTVERARARARRRRRNGRLWKIPAASLASLAACFVLLVNVFPTFALACSHVPLLRDLAAAVAFPPVCPPPWSTTACSISARPRPWTV